MFAFFLSFATFFSEFKAFPCKCYRVVFLYKDFIGLVVQEIKAGGIVANYIFEVP